MSKILDSLGFSSEEVLHINQNLDELAQTPNPEVELSPQETQDFIKSERIAAHEEESTSEVSAAVLEIQETAKASLDFLAGISMPTVFQFLFPPVFIMVWQWLTEYVTRTRDFSQLVLGLPRGFGKSTLMKIFILFCILFTKKKFILVIAARAELAENIISDVVDMLDEPNIKSVFGDWRIGIEKDTQGIKKFGFRGRNIILAGLGSGTSLRGLNLKNERPDVMLFDDVQTRECADSVVESNKLIQWMIGTAMKAKSPLGCLYIFVGNMYPTKNSILRQLKTNPQWVKFIAGGILADGTSLWEELQPIKQLIAEYQSDLAMGHPEIFFSEVLNDENASANNLIDYEKLPPYPVQQGDIAAGNFIVIDPSNDKANSDAVTITYFEVHYEKPVARKIIEDRLSPGEIIKQSLKLALENNCRLIVVESNAYQYSLLYWFQHFSEQYLITGIHFVPIYSGASSKNSRILGMLKSYASGELYIHPDCVAQVHSQIAGFNPLKRDNTDGILDCLTYAPRVLTEHQDFIISLGTIQEQEYSNASVLPVEYTSSF